MVEPVSTSQEINELSEKLQMLDGNGEQLDIYHTGAGVPNHQE